MSNKYIDTIYSSSKGSKAVDSPDQTLSFIGKIIGGGVALIAAFGGGIYLIGKLGDKYNVDAKLNAYGKGLADDLESFQQGLDKRKSGETLR